MDRELLTKHLALAEKHVLEGERHIRRQREIIEELRQHGHDTSAASKLLAEFERTQASHIADRDRLRGELSAQ